MQKTAFFSWQFSLICLFVIGNALYLPSPFASFGISLFVGGIISAIAFYFLGKFMGNMDLLEIKGFKGVLIAVLFVIMACRIIVNEIYRLCVFWKDTTFVSVPIAITMVLVFASALWLARIGTIHLAKWALPTLCFVAVILILSILFTVPEWDFAYIDEMIVFDFYQSLNSAMAYYLSVIFVFVLLSPQKNSSKAMFWGVVVGSLAISITAVRNVLLLGEYTANNILYPSFASAGLVSIGDFFQRAEVLFASGLVLCQIARIAVYCLVTARGIRRIFMGANKANRQDSNLKAIKEEHQKDLKEQL